LNNSVDTGVDSDVSPTAMYKFKPGAQIFIFLTVLTLLPCVTNLPKEFVPQAIPRFTSLSCHLPNLFILRKCYVEI